MAYRNRYGYTGRGRGFPTLILALCIVLGAATLIIPRLRHAVATELPRLRHAIGDPLIGDHKSAVASPVVCRAGNVLAGVYGPGRLAVHGRCVTVSGRVILIIHAPDGDVHLSLLPDRGYWRLLDARNYVEWAGSLVVEVIPADQGRVSIPAVGTHVRVTGAYVTDLQHGWREIHPAWQIVPTP